jgi:hypothetical protein
MGVKGIPWSRPARRWGTARWISRIGCTINGCPRRADRTSMSWIMDGLRTQLSATYPQPKMTKGLAVSANPLILLGGGTRV